MVNAEPSLRGYVQYFPRSIAWLFVYYFRDTTKVEMAYGGYGRCLRHTVGST